MPAEWRTREVEYGDLMLLVEWQDASCAVCGSKGTELVEDHDWNTGLTRGYLCRSCNTREAKSDSPLWRAYRERPPTAILGMTIEYVSMMGTPTTRSQRDPAELRKAAGMLHVPYVKRKD